jgi:hypothetical protein
VVTCPSSSGAIHSCLRDTVPTSPRDLDQMEDDDLLVCGGAVLPLLPAAEYEPLAEMACVARGAAHALASTASAPQGVAATTVQPAQCGVVADGEPRGPPRGGAAGRRRAGGARGGPREPPAAVPPREGRGRLSGH